MFYFMEQEKKEVSKNKNEHFHCVTIDYMTSKLIISSSFFFFFQEIIL